jgi:DNA-binding transcriptional LysR family regulator
MQLGQLAYFVAVAEEAHFTRAAERLGIAQPAVSVQIRRLEAELGERLFLRGPRAAALTAAGEALLPHARAALAAVEHGREAVAALRGLITGRLAIGLVQPLPDREVVRTIGAFRREHPRVGVRVAEGETDALLGAVERGELEAAFTGFGPGQEPPPGLGARLVAREPTVIAVAPDHPLAGRRRVRLRALRDEPFVTLTAASRLRSVLEAACAEAGFAPRIAIETSDLGVMTALAAEGAGVALLPRSGLQGAGDLVPVELSEPRIERRIVLVWRRDNLPPAARAFLTLFPDC